MVLLSFILIIWSIFVTYPRMRVKEIIDKKGKNNEGNWVSGKEIEDEASPMLKIYFFLAVTYLLNQGELISKGSPREHEETYLKNRYRLTKRRRR